MGYGFLHIRHYRRRQKRERVAVYQLYIGEIKFHTSKTEKKSLSREALVQIYTKKCTG